MAEHEMTEEESEKLLNGEDDQASAEGGDVTQPPEWAVMPANVKLPKAGLTMAYIRIPAKWTTDPARGDRWCAVWQIDEVGERLAYARGKGDQSRVISELAKACIRVVDGHKADWSATRKPGCVAEFWSGIGPKGRLMVRNYYLRTHTLEDEETLDFFASHFVNVTVG